MVGVSIRRRSLDVSGIAAASPWWLEEENMRAGRLREGMGVGDLSD